jgi:glycosyltransferase involved in cell wall biosynthesis
MLSRRRRLRGVAIVVHNIDAVGGMERQALRLAERLDARGIPVTIVTTWHEPKFGLPLRPTKPWYERRGRIEIVRVPSFPNWTLDAIEDLIDVVGTYALMRRRKKVDVIYGVQFTGAYHAAHIAEATGMPTAVKFACGGEPGDFCALARQVHAEAIRAALRRMDRYVLISEEIRQEAERAGLDPSRFVKIRNGVDTKRFTREGPAAALPELGAAPERQVILFVGRHDPQKRVDVLLRAFKRVLETVPEARLASAGQGPYLEEYRKLAVELGVSDRVAFLGARPDVEALHRAASVFVLPSGAEGLPNALLEALACGTPSVATAIPGTTDVVTHEKEALLVPVDDPEALAAAIVRMLRDRALAERLARAGRERIMAEFDMERVTDRYVELFRELAATVVVRVSFVRYVALQVRFLGTAIVLAWRLGRFFSAIATMHAREGITRTVVRVKGFFGIRGDILPRRGVLPG